MAPHAGYTYSGATAAVSFNSLKKAGTYLLIGPNHTALGDAVAVFPDGAWKTPLGEVKVNGSISKKIAEQVPGASLDRVAHLQEHSLEVQLPFLQVLNKKDFSVVPITLGTEDLDALKALGKALYEISQEEKIGVIASSDFTHFLTLEEAKEKDMEAIEFIKKLDLEGFEKLVREKNLSICGHTAISSIMEYCKLKGCSKGKLLKYDTSATASGDSLRVVGYAAIAFL